MSSLATSAFDDVLDALGNPLRRKIISILGEEGALPVGALAEQLPVSRPAVSKHLRILEDAQLVSHEQHGNSNLFSLQPRGFGSARAWLDQFWDDALARFAMVAENLPERGEPSE